MALTIVHITDPHIGADWGDGGRALEAAIGAVGDVLPGAPDAVVVSGDIANTPTEEEYREARALFDGFAAPVSLVPGNHDDRGLLRQAFGLPSAPEDHVSFHLDLGPLQVVGLDTQLPGQGIGQFDPVRAEWLDRTLSAGPDTPTLLVMHHPPLLTGVPSIDAMGIPAAECAQLESVVSKHPKVQLIAAGHVHRAILGRLGRIPVLAIPSTDVQLALDFENPALRLVREPPCFAVHILQAGQIVTHLQPIPVGS